MSIGQEPVEIQREEGAPLSRYSYHAVCRGCGRDILLWWNGGELDEQKCCGYIYRLEHAGAEFVGA